MKTMTKNNLTKLTAEYAKLTENENAIAAKKKELGLEIMNSIESMKMTSVTVQQGIFSVFPVTSWIFSKKVQKMEDLLSNAKESEKEKEIAKKVIIRQSIRFTPKK